MKLLRFIALIVILMSCKATKNHHIMINDQAPVVVYKTKADYFDKVAVGLNDSKTAIVSYPSPGDLKAGGEFALPVRLKKGYLLDRRGLNINSAFTSFTYEQYAAMESAPSVEKLFGSIIDKDPFVEFHVLRDVQDYNDVVQELNRKIRRGSL